MIEHDGQPTLACQTRPERPGRAPQSADPSPRKPKRMKTTKLPLLALALLASLQHPIQSLGISCSVKGKFSYQVFELQKEGEPLPTEPLLREFEVLSDNCAWKIRVVLVGNTNFDSFIYSYDGTNLLQYSIPGSARAKGGAMASVTVEASAVPATVTSAAGEYLWLAFASGCYFKGQTNDRALSFERPKSKYGVVRRFEVSCRVAPSSSPPYLPTAIDYVSTTQATVVQDDGTLGVVALTPSFGDGGYTSAEFKSGGFTNVQGLSFPTHFEYRKYRPNPDAKTTNDLTCVLIVRGEVTSISTKEEGVNCALPDRSFMIYDLRVPEPNVLYPIRDGRIPAVNSEVVEAAREKALNRLKQSRE